jgi:hypothetical protein
MRLFYFLLKVNLQYAFRIYFSKIKLVNPPKRFFGRTIYVSNHASSFFDPVVLGVTQRPIVFFMTRSDVFKPFLKPILWGAHMLPIYREHDGEDTKGKNEAVFKKCSRVLSFGRNLLIFGEGFTDDIFVRRLKPVKKGAARIGFGTLESLEWKKKIYVAAIGINYSDPNYFGGDLLISNSERFCLNDYHDLYKENPAKAIHEVTKRIEKLMQDQITHVENKSWTDFHEHVLRLKRKGLHPIDTDRNIPLKQRWENSRKLALLLNSQNLNDNIELNTLKQDLDTYFKLQKRMKVEERYLFELSKNKKLSIISELNFLLLGAIFIPVGLFHFFLPYTLVKRFAEKTFKRKVFWSSVKVILGTLILALFNIPIVVLMNKFLFHDTLVAWIYYLILPLIGLITYKWFRTFKVFKTKRVLSKMNLNSLLAKRSELIQRIETLLP